MNPSEPESSSQGQSVSKFGPRSSKWKILFLSLLIFVGGVVIGAGGTLVLGKKAIFRAIHHPPEPGRMAHRLKRRLALSDLQFQKVQEILSTRTRQIHEIRKSEFPKINEQFKLMREEIADILDKDQERIWREQMKRFQPFMQPHGLFPPHHRRPPDRRPSKNGMHRPSESFPPMPPNNG